MPETLRTETESGVRSIVLTRADEYNTITPALREELDAALDEADADREVRVILLRAEGRAFCAGYGLDWSTSAQAQEIAAAPESAAPASRDRPAPWLPGTAAPGRRVWDSVGDLRMMERFVAT